MASTKRYCDAWLGSLGWAYRNDLACCLIDDGHLPGIAEGCFEQFLTTLYHRVKVRPFLVNGIVGGHCTLLKLDVSTKGGEGSAVLFGLITNSILGCFEDLLNGFDDGFKANVCGYWINLALHYTEGEGGGDVGDVSLADVALGDCDEVSLGIVVVG